MAALVSDRLSHRPQDDTPIIGFQKILNDYYAREPQPPRLSRFLELPQELQDKIYGHVYEEGYGIDAFMSDDFRTSTQPKYVSDEEWKMMRAPDLVLSSDELSGLEDVSKKVRADSCAARELGFNGHLNVGWDKSACFQALNALLKDSFKKLRARTTVLDLSNHTIFCRMKKMPTLFPILTKIHFSWDANRNVNVDRYS